MTAVLPLFVTLIRIPDRPQCLTYFVTGRVYSVRTGSGMLLVTVHIRSKGNGREDGTPFHVKYTRVCVCVALFPRVYYDRKERNRITKRRENSVLIYVSMGGPYREKYGFLMQRKSAWELNTYSKPGEAGNVTSKSFPRHGTLLCCVINRQFPEQY